MAPEVATRREKRSLRRGETLAALSDPDAKRRLAASESDPSRASLQVNGCFRDLERALR